MLSRTADNLFWLSRYVERADFVARILDAALRLSALPASYGGGETNEWESALASAGKLRDPATLRAQTERLLAEIDPSILKLCLDTGHSHYAGFDPVAFMKRHRARLAYVHFKDIDPRVKADAVAKRTGFYDACAQGIFCNLGKGMTDFTAVRELLLSTGYEGWCTVEQDCDPSGPTSPVDDARENRAYLKSIGF